MSQLSRISGWLVRTFLFVVVSGVVLTACDTFTQQKGQTMTKEEQQQRRIAREQQRQVDEQGRIAEEDARRASESERRAREKQREEAKQLREKYERYTTAELKLMHQRYLE